jgi:hypothetical protein
MDVRPALNGPAGLANGPSVFDDLFSLAHGPNCNLMTQRNRFNRLDQADFLSFQGYGPDLITGRHILDDDGDIVNGLVHQGTM